MGLAANRSPEPGPRRGRGSASRGNLLVSAPLGDTVRRWIGPIIAGAASQRAHVTDADAATGLGGRRAKPLSLGIDIGRTFTDIVVVDHATGRRFSRKVLSPTAIPGLE